MSFLQVLTDLFDSIFRSSSPEVQKRQKIKKIENDLRMHPSGLYKNELVQPNFAEALRVLYINTRPIGQILENTICSSDIKRNHRFEGELIITGYSDDDKKLLDSLSYENRKSEAQLDDKAYERQHKSIDKILTSLQSKAFEKMDGVIARLTQLNDLCKFNFVAPLKLFDGSFDAGNPEYSPRFLALPAGALENIFQDLYYITAELNITQTEGNAILALYQLMTGTEYDGEKRKEIFSYLRKIEAIIKSILNSETLTNLICLAKNEPAFVPQRATYKIAACRNLAMQLQTQFAADEARMKNEIKDQIIMQDLESIFGARKLVELEGYNGALASDIGSNISANFMWITPLRILKTFMLDYYSEGLKSLLNDIVVEGFFANNSYKSDFSQDVADTNEIMDRIQAFEASFAKDGKYDTLMLHSLIEDSHKNADFGKKLGSLVDNINADAKDIIQRETGKLLSLHKKMADLMQDSKRSASELVSNLKVLMYSSRNRDYSLTLENQHQAWGIFFDIMKNYAIIKA